jgi:hypothetical protein
MYVVENITKGLPAQSDAFAHFSSVRDQLIADEFRVSWVPLRQPADPLKMKHLQAQLRQKNQLQLQLHQLEAMKRSMEDSEYKAFQKKRLDLLQSEIARQNLALQALLRELGHEEPIAVVQKLKDAEPWVRWAAIQVASKKWLAVEKELIGLLSDAHPAVRDAARQGLVRLSRGNDFGPPAKASAVQVAQAQESWQTWLDLQTAARKPANYYHD